MARPLQVYLDDHDLDRLEAWARERGWTKSQAIRVAVRALTRRPADDPLLGLSGDIDGLPADLSANFQRYLDETFVAESPAPLPHQPPPLRQACSSIAAPGSRAAAGATNIMPRRTDCFETRSRVASRSSRPASSSPRPIA
jgi:hypothetical protein